jgi:hypothetical protein
MSAMDDRSALRLTREIAYANRARCDANDFEWQGLAFSLDASTYGA